MRHTTLKVDKGRLHKTKSGKSVVFCQTGGGGRVSEGSKMPNLYFGKVFFQLACRIILGPPKHLLHLVWSCLDVYQALKTTLKVLVNSYFMLANSGRIMTINKGNLFIFEVGPSVKFVSAIKGRVSLKIFILSLVPLGIIYGGKIVETARSDLKTTQKRKFGLFWGHF